MELGMYGLGRMGGNMARRLHRAGHRVVAPDLIGTATITASDAAKINIPTISVADVIVGEGQGFVDFVIRLSAPSINAVSVNYDAYDISARDYDGDYVDTGSGNLTFAAGETVKTVRVAIGNDVTAEGLESFGFRIYSCLRSKEAMKQPL